MLIPYSTDAPIYYFPWMTIVLIVANAVCFAITGMGHDSDGWLLTYGNGLHPLEWVAYNFLHFGFMHLIGNMFFLWSFGIVVEGKLGWWKFLCLYLGIGIVGGMLIQIAMLWYVPRDPFAVRETPAERSWIWSGNSVYAQEIPFPDNAGIRQVPGMDAEFDADDLPDPTDPAKNNPGGQFQGRDVPFQFEKPGAGGASLVIYGLMAIVLIWAPRNEIHCAWMFGFRAGQIEVEYLYFCGFYIATELLSAVFSVRGFEVTSEIGHLTGAMVGAGLGVLLVKQDWVDCENWDIFSIMSGKHSAAVNVGDWKENYVIPHVGRGKYEETLTERAYSDDDSFIPKKKKKKAKPLPKLVELDSMDDEFDEGELDVTVALPAGKRSADPNPSRSERLPTSRSGNAAPNEKTSREVAELVSSGQYKAAMRAYLELKSLNTDFQLEQDLLRQLSDGLFKAKAINEAATTLDEYIRRFPAKAAHQRVKLSILYIKYLSKPTAALKMLVKVDPKSLSEDYRPIYAKAKHEAQQMISNGVTDES